MIKLILTQKIRN